jgi:hypothetical protein
MSLCSNPCGERTHAIATLVRDRHDGIEGLDVMGKPDVSQAGPLGGETGSATLDGTGDLFKVYSL